MSIFQTKICDSLKCRLLKILPRVLSVEKKLTEKDYFALHSHIPNVLKNIGDPDQTPRSAASDLGLQCLLCQLPFLGFPDYNGLNTACFKCEILN